MKKIIIKHTHTNLRRAQVWVETVVYTLIGLSIIGLVLAFATPKINEMKDKAVIEQTINAMNEIDSKIIDVSATAGNTRAIELRIGRGEMDILGKEDSIMFVLDDSHYVYSEPGAYAYIGDIRAKTEKKAKTSRVELLLNYTGRFNITWQGIDTEKQFFKASVPYRLLVENNNYVINFREGS